MKELKKETFVTSEGEEVEFTHSSGNIFADLGLEDAETLQLKSSLIAQISQTIRQQGWTQAKAAKVIGMAQPDISKMMRGNLDSVSVEKLLDVLNRLGHSVEIKVMEREEASGKIPGYTRVVTGKLQPARAGSVSTEAKANAARVNGAKGGKPRKKPLENKKIIAA